MDNFQQMQTVPVAGGCRFRFYTGIFGAGMRGKVNFRIFALCKNLCAYAEKTELIAGLCVCALCAPGVQAGTPNLLPLSSAARSLFDYGRWSDARHEFLRAPGRFRLPTVSRRRRSTSIWRPVPSSWAAVTPKGRSAISKHVTPDRSMPTTCGSRWAPTIAPRAI